MEGTENNNEGTQNQPQPQPQPQQNNFNNGAIAIPNSTAVLVLGILSIVLCTCAGIVGLVLGIIALAMYGKAKKLFDQNPQSYSQSSFSNLKAGRICAIIGLCVSGLYILYIIIYLIFFGAMLAMPWQAIIRSQSTQNGVNLMMHVFHFVH